MGEQISTLRSWLAADKSHGNEPVSHFRRDGGGSRIRTHEGVTPLTVFKTAAFNHSAIPPRSKKSIYWMRLPWQIALPFAPGPLSAAAPILSRARSGSSVFRPLPIHSLWFAG